MITRVVDGRGRQFTLELVGAYQEDLDALAYEVRWAASGQTLGFVSAMFLRDDGCEERECWVVAEHAGRFASRYDALLIIAEAFRKTRGKRIWETERKRRERRTRAERGGQDGAAFPGGIAPADP